MTSPRPSLVKAEDSVYDHVDVAPQVVEIDGFHVVGMHPRDVAFYTNFGEENRKRVYRKVDIRLIPMLAMLYLIAHIDRANIGNAKIEGMIEDLGLTSVQYSTVLAIFFVPYVLFEVPSNILLKRFKRPSTYLGLLCTLWGIIMTCTGLVQGYGDLMALRVLLGVFEAGFFPGAIYLCSYWYPPKHMSKRVAYFYCASALSGAFSGLLAAGIAQMDGVGGYAGWRWIFLLEGIVTVVLGCACFFLLIDSPALSTRWLEPDEIRYLELAMFIKDGGITEDSNKAGGGRPTRRDLMGVFTNWRIYVQAYFLVCQSSLSYGVKFALPTICEAMGFETTTAQLVSAPPYVFAAASAVTFATVSDRFYRRMPFVAIPLTIVAVAYSIIISFQGELEKFKGPTYFAIVLAVIGIYPIQAAAATWNSNNIAPASRRSVGIAFMNCVGNCGGIVGSFMFPDSTAPEYNVGFGLSLAFGATGAIVAPLLAWSYRVANRNKAKLAEEAREKYTDQELFDMGDRSPFFVHVL